MQGQGCVRSQGRTVELFLGRCVCHLLKQLTDTPLVQPGPLEPQSGAKGSGCESGGLPCWSCGKRVQGREGC